MSAASWLLVRRGVHAGRRPPSPRLGLGRSTGADTGARRPDGLDRSRLDHRLTHPGHPGNCRSSRRRRAHRPRTRLRSAGPGVDRRRASHRRLDIPCGTLAYAVHAGTSAVVGAHLAVGPLDTRAGAAVGALISAPTSSASLTSSRPTSTGSRRGTTCPTPTAAPAATGTSHLRLTYKTQFCMSAPIPPGCAHTFGVRKVGDVSEGLGAWLLTGRLESWDIVWPQLRTLRVT